MKLTKETIVKIDNLIKELRQFNHTEAATMLAKLHDHAVRTQDFDEIKKSRDDYKDAWYKQRAVSGKESWAIPRFSYLKRVPIDPQNYAYMIEVSKLIAKFVRVIVFVMWHHQDMAEKREAKESIWQSRWGFAPSEKTMEYYRKLLHNEG